MSGSATGEREDTLAVDRPVGDEVRSDDSLSFEDFDLSATYTDDGHETPALLITTATPSGDEIERVLYQFGSSLPTFVGGDTFTGLHYVHSADAELQWWCTAED